MRGLWHVHLSDVFVSRCVAVQRLRGLTRMDLDRTPFQVMGQGTRVSETGGRVLVRLTLPIFRVVDRALGAERGPALQVVGMQSLDLG